MFLKTIFIYCSSDFIDLICKLYLFTGNICSSFSIFTLLLQNLQNGIQNDTGKHLKVEYFTEIDFKYVVQYYFQTSVSNIARMDNYGEYIKGQQTHQDEKCQLKRPPMIFNIEETLTEEGRLQVAQKQN